MHTTVVFFFFPLSFFDNVPVVPSTSRVKMHKRKAELATRATLILDQVLQQCCWNIKPHPWRQFSLLVLIAMIWTILSMKCRELDVIQQSSILLLKIWSESGGYCCLARDLKGKSKSNTITHIPGIQVHKDLWVLAAKELVASTFFKFLIFSHWCLISLAIYLLIQ